MQLLTLVHSLDEANKIARKLKEKGIATFISSGETARMTNTPIFGIVKVGVWIVLDYQYEDAVEVMKNPDHEVAQPLGPSELAQLSKDTPKPYSTASKKFIYLVIKVVIAVVVLCVVAYVLRTSYSGS